VKFVLILQDQTNFMILMIPAGKNAEKSPVPAHLLAVLRWTCSNFKCVQLLSVGCCICHHKQLFTISNWYIITVTE